jgi:predicted aminopeptidase
LIKKTLFLALLLIAALVVWQYKLVLYGIEQGIGQLKIIYKAAPLEEVLKDPAFPDSLKQKLLLVGQIKKFAVDSLGIKDSPNYSTLYNQQGKPILWVLTASEKFRLRAKEWHFPFLGDVSYKGFFNYEKGLLEQSKLIQEGYDTDYDVVSGWSTLGWFKDPILSNMLLKKEGNLANLIIHELTHGTLYIKNNVDFNENLASFIGDKGAEQFLILKYGLNSMQYKRYEEGKFDMALYSNHILEGATRLDSLYKTFSDETPVLRKEKLKKKFIQQIILSANTLPFYKKTRFSKLFSKDKMPNNAFFIDYKRYMSKQNQFELEFRNRFHSNLRNYLSFLKIKYAKE